MANIGCLPTKNTVRITSDSGAHGTMSEATQASAGCMTAEHVRRLDACYAAMQAGGSSPITVIEPNPDSVSRAEFVTALSRVQRQTIDLSPIHQQIADLSARVETPMIAHDDPSKRIIVAALADLDQRVSQIETIFSMIKETAAIKAQETT